MDKLKKDNIWRFVEGLNLDLRRRQLIGKLIEEIVDSFADGVPAASNDNIGGIKTGYTQNGKNYPVTLDENKKAYVNVPWTDNNTTYGVMTPATANTDGKAGLVPAPKAGDQGRFLQASGGWGTPANTTYSKATNATLGLVKIGYTTNGKNYPVLLDSDGKMYVAVPWTDTKYNLPAATPNSIGGVKQGPKVANASSDADTVALGTKINELIASLRSAGVII